MTDETQRVRRRGPLRRAGSVAGWLLLVAFVAAIWPVQLGGRAGLVVVSGHSMDGTYRTGDLLATWRHSSYDVGDVAVYRVPGNGVGHGLRVVHRIIGRTDGGFVMQGDNRTTPDQWHPTTHDVVGRPFARVPAGGLILSWALNPLMLAFACGVCVFLLVANPGRGAKKTDDTEPDSAPVPEPEPLPAVRD